MKTVIAFTLLVAGLALAYIASDHHDILNQPKYAPNLVMKVKNVTVKADDGIDPRTNPYLKAVVEERVVVINKRTSPSGEGTFVHGIVMR